MLPSPTRFNVYMSTNTRRTTDISVAHQAIAEYWPDRPDHVLCRRRWCRHQPDMDGLLRTSPFSQEDVLYRTKKAAKKTTSPDAETNSLPAPLPESPVADALPPVAELLRVPVGFEPEPALEELAVEGLARKLLLMQPWTQLLKASVSSAVPLP